MVFSIGDKVKVSIDNDNENYDSFRNKVLIIVCKDKICSGYDWSLFPQYIYSFKYENGVNCPFSLYDYELRAWLNE